MPPKTFFLSALAIIALIGLLAFLSRAAGVPVAGSSQGTPQAESHSLTTEQPFFNFGVISMKDGLVQHDFVITNTASSTITIAAIDTSCMCTTAYVLKQGGDQEGPFGMEGMSSLYNTNIVLVPGATTTIRAVYDPNAHGPAGVGHIERVISLYEKDGATLELEIAATVTP